MLTWSNFTCTECLVGLTLSLPDSEKYSVLDVGDMPLDDYFLKLSTNGFNETIFNCLWGIRDKSNMSWVDPSTDMKDVCHILVAESGKVLVGPDCLSVTQQLYRHYANDGTVPELEVPLAALDQTTVLYVVFALCRSTDFRIPIQSTGNIASTIPIWCDGGSRSCFQFLVH